MSVLVEFSRMADRITGFDVYTIGDTVYIALNGSRGFASSIEIQLPLEHAKTLAAMLVAAVRRIEQEKRKRERMRMYNVLQHLPENLQWLLEG